MRYVWISSVFLAILLLGPSASYARMAPVKPGTVVTVSSDNGRYEMIISHEVGGMVSWAMKQDGRELWNEMFMGSTGDIKISDNGETIIMSSWGWQDEGGSDGVVVYDKHGKFVKKVLFGQDEMSRGALKWVRARGISPDGRYFAVGQATKDLGEVSLYDISTGKLVWEKSVGYEDVAEIKIASQAKNILVATYAGSGQGMMFLLLDKKGEIVWQKKIARNYSWNVPRYLGFKDNGLEFEIYHMKAGTFKVEKLPGYKKGAVLEEQK